MLRTSRMVVSAYIKSCAVLLLLVALLLAFVDTVAAKGPESVTIRGPGMEQPVELMDHDDWEPMRLLMEQTGLWYGVGDLPRPIEAPSGELGPAYTLTWINGGPPDKSVEERTMVQLLYLHAEGGPVIHTPPQKGLGGWGPGVIGWFVAPDGFMDTLAALGAPVSTELASGGIGLRGRLSAGVVPCLALTAFVVVVALVGGVGVRRSGSQT